MYKTTVVEIGELVSDFEEDQLVVLFGPQATPELRSICVIHEGEEVAKDVLESGKKILFGTQEYTIREVGSAANETFNELGHVSIYFKDDAEELLPGAVMVTPSQFPLIQLGDTIKITA